MGKFTRTKEPTPGPKPVSERPRFIEGAYQRPNTLTARGEPVTRQESFQTNRFIALKMIHSFCYRQWMDPYLSKEEIFKARTII